MAYGPAMRRGVGCNRPVPILPTTRFSPYRPVEVKVNIFWVYAVYAVYAAILRKTPQKTTNSEKHCIHCIQSGIEICFSYFIRVFAG